MEQALAGLYIEEPAPFRLGNTIALALERGAFRDDVRVRCDALVAREVAHDAGLPPMLRTIPVRTTWLDVTIVDRGAGRLVVRLPDEPPEALGAPGEPIAFVLVAEDAHAIARCRLPYGPNAFVVSSFDPDESVVISGPPGG